MREKLRQYIEYYDVDMDSTQHTHPQPETEQVRYITLYITEYRTRGNLVEIFSTQNINPRRGSLL